MATATLCQVCGLYGCTASNHRRCSACGERGHTCLTCTNEDSSSESNGEEKIRPISTQRSSTASLTQVELDMASRVLIGCEEEKEKGPFDEGIIERASRLTGIGRKKIGSIYELIRGGLKPTVSAVRRGRPKGSSSRDICTKIRKTIGILHKQGVMSTVPKIARNLDYYEGIRLSNTQLLRIMHKMGFEYSRPGPSQIVLAHESQAMANYRYDYLRAVTAARRCREIIYLDESYVNTNHSQSKCWLSEESKIFIPSGKGRRYVLYGAGSRNGWVGNPVVFPCKGTGDYHDAMNAQHFEELFEETCRVAEELLGPSMIVMDNAAYHKRLSSERDRITYWHKLPAKDVIEAWKNKEVPGQDNYVGPDLVHKKTIIEWLRKNPPKGVCQAKVVANRHGHDILLLPPYHPELNAIEKAWGTAKNRVAQLNSPHVGFKDLGVLIVDSLTKVGLSTWCKLDTKCLEEEAVQLAMLQEGKNREEEFRAAHPDLVFSLSDSESEDDMELAEGVDGQNVELVEGVHGGVPESEMEAVENLLLLGQPRFEE